MIPSIARPTESLALILPDVGPAPGWPGKAQQDHGGLDTNQDYVCNLDNQCPIISHQQKMMLASLTSRLQLSRTCSLCCTGRAEMQPNFDCDIRIFTKRN